MTSVHVVGRPNEIRYREITAIMQRYGREVEPELTWGSEVASAVVQQQLRPPQNSGLDLSSPAIEREDAWVSITGREPGYW